MKKRSVNLILTAFILILLVTSVSANIKSNKGTYHTKESVFVRSTVGQNDHLCRGQNPPEKVVVFIVRHDEDWDDGDAFEDVRGEPSEIPNSKFSTTKIWDTPQPGNYDLIVDCNENGIYEEAIEPIYSKGFIVIPKKGEGSMSSGSKSPAEFKWQFDPEQKSKPSVIFQMELKAIDEDIQLNSINLKLNTQQELNNLEIYFDSNNNGLLDSNDELLAKKESSKKSETIPLDFKIRQDIEENLIFVLNNNENTHNGDYNLEVISLTGTGILSDKEIKFFGNPLKSNIMKIIDKKTCIGEISLELIPNPTALNQEVTAKIAGLTGCNNKKVILKSNDCFVATGNLDECTLEDNTCEMKLSGIKGKYSACIDKNDNNNYNDFGESTLTDLALTSEPKEQKDTVDLTGEPAKVTGGVIGNLENLDLDSNLIIALEITLLLILTFLVLIFFRILKPKTTEPVSEEKEDDSDLFDEVKEEIKENKKEDDKDDKDELFDELEEKKKEIIDKVEKDKKESKKK
jgi:hypothetical protein